MKCRCGHGLSDHWTTANARYKRRARRATGAPRRPCHALVRGEPRTFQTVLRGQAATVSHAPIRPCKCRDWHPEENPA